MKHEERIQLARNYCDKIEQKYGDIILLAGYFGSTARETDTEWSDLELLAVTRDGSTLASGNFLIKGITFSPIVMTESILVDNLSKDLFGWPYWMGVLDSLKVIKGNEAIRTKFMDIGREVPAEKFLRELQSSLPWLTSNEEFGRVRSCVERNNIADIPFVVAEIIGNIDLCLCMLNQSWSTHANYLGLVETFKFQKLPEGYSEIIPQLWGSRDIETVLPLTERLMVSFTKLLLENGLTLPEPYSGFNELPL